MSQWLFLGASAAASGAPDCSFRSAYPRQYVAYYAEDPPELNGELDKPFWRDVPWTEDFVDISTDEVPRFKTRAKVRWDDVNLYVAAELEEPNIWAYETEHDSVIFNDNDFEVFTDPGGTTHYYKEYEMNAINTNWDLCLNKPYRDGGYENSSRVFGKHGFDMPLRSATKVFGGLNDPSVPSIRWTVEVALPIAGLMVNQSSTFLPKNKGFWRIDFSRVEYHVLVDNGMYVKDPKYPDVDNWVWGAQAAIDMHLPERWPFLQFSTDQPNATQPLYNPEFPVRYAVAAAYNAQQAYSKEHNGTFTDKVEDLLSYNPPPNTLDGSCVSLPAIYLSKDKKRFQVLINSNPGPAGVVPLWKGPPSSTPAREARVYLASILENRYLSVAVN